MSNKLNKAEESIIPAASRMIVLAMKDAQERGLQVEFNKVGGAANARLHITRQERSYFIPFHIVTALAATDERIRGQRYYVIEDKAVKLAAIELGFLPKI